MSLLGWNAGIQSLPSLQGNMPNTRKLQATLEATLWLLREAGWFVSFTFAGGCDVPGPTIPAPGPPSHPLEALGRRVIFPLLRQVADTGFSHSVFLGNA